MGLEIRLAESEDDLEAIYRFRYDIYVVEMQRKQRYADHAQRRIADPLDSCGHVLGAWEDGALVGTLRTNFLRESDVGEYFDMYKLSAFSAETLPSVSISTRLMISPTHRKSTLAIHLICTNFEFCVAEGLSIDVMDCNAHLVPFFSKLGYQIHRDDLVHPEYGDVTVMYLQARDVRHLERIGSPFACVHHGLQTGNRVILHRDGAYSRYKRMCGACGARECRRVS